MPVASRMVDAVVQPSTQHPISHEVRGKTQADVLVGFFARCCCRCRVPYMQVIREEAGEKFLQNRIKDQQHALADLRADPGLGKLQLIEGPLFDLEVRGVPALQYFGSIVWK